MTPSEGKDSNSSDSGLSHIFYCCYKPLPLHWALHCGILLYLFIISFLNLIFKPIIIFFYYFIPLFAFPTFIFPLQLIFNVYKYSLSTSI